MQPETQEAPPNPMWMTVLGWIVSVLPALGLIASGVVKVLIVTKNFKPPEGSPDIGWPESTMLGLAIVEIGCTVLYLFPRTAVLGAILLTGYLGGAVATHVRIGDPPFYGPIIFGVLVWFGLILRDQRLRATLPWRGDSSVPATGGFLAACGKIVLTLVVLVGVLAALIEAQPTEFHLTRSIKIDAPPSKVFEQVNDFHKWKAWSPWEKLDPAAKNTFEGPESGPGAIFKWSSTNDGVGEGMMTLTENKPNESIRIKLDFERPRKDTGIVEFTFKAEGDKTLVTWSMTGERDFVGKAMWVAFVEKLVGGSFEEGLKNIKGVVEAKKGDGK